MTIQQRFTVSAIWTDKGNELVTVVLDTASAEKAARTALDKHFPKHDEVWVYSWLTGELVKFGRAERGKVLKAGGAI